jgi:hypothetical protein
MIILLKKTLIYLSFICKLVSPVLAQFLLLLHMYDDAIDTQLKICNDSVWLKFGCKETALAPVSPASVRPCTEYGVYYGYR